MTARRNDPPQELPNNIEAEQALLGAVMVNNQAMIAVNSTGLEPRHFYEPLHQRIFEAMRAGHRAGKNMNPVTVKAGMSPVDAAQPIGSLTFSGYLAMLCSEAVSVVNAPDHAKAILLAAARRESLTASEVAEVAARHTGDELSFLDQIREVRDRYDNIIRAIEGSEESSTSFLDAIDITLDRTNDAMAGRTPTGIDPGIPEIMTLTGPWQPGQLIIIGGGVKQGKSAMAMQSLFTIAERHPVAVNSGEMSRDQLIMREKARRTGISARKQQRGQISDSEMQDLLQAGQDMKRLKFIDIDCRRLTLQQHEAKIERLIGEHGIAAYFLDHIGKIQWTGKMETEDEFKQGQKATSLLKDMAQKHKIPIVALTHLKKSTFQDYQGRSFKDRISSAINRRPTYRDLVGNMDKDADQVLIVFQPKPIVAGMEPEEGTSDYEVWREAMDRIQGRAEIILSLSRESEFPRRKEIVWNGESTSYGPPFKQVQNSRGLL